MGFLSLVGVALKKVPWWLWIILLVGGVFGVREWRTNRLIAQLKSEVQASQEKAIKEAQDAARKSIADYAAQATQLQATVKALQQQAAQAAAKSAALTAQLATQEQARKALVETGTLEDVIRAGEALGYHPLRAPRP